VSRFFLASFVVALCVSGCRPPPTTVDLTVLVGRGADVIGLDPARVNDSESTEVTEQIFDHLVRYQRNSTQIEPALAVAWEVSEHGTAWTFYLRDGVLFHDGTPCDADAVVFSFNRQRDAAHPYHLPDFTYWDNTYRNIRSVEKVDRLTVRIRIDRPYAPFLANLAMFPVSIVSPTAVAHWGPEFSRHPVGTGPFRFVEWSPGERVTLEANPHYWDGAPQIQHLVFVNIPDPRQRLVSLEGDAIDVAENLSPQDLQFVGLHPALELHRVASDNVGYLAMNVTHPPFDDLRVRRAVNYAINKRALVKLTYQGLAQVASSPVPPAMWGHVDEPDYSYQPETAIRLLREANFVAPEVHPKLFIMDTPRSYMPAPETVARIIQHNLRDVGIEVDVVKAPFDEHLRRTQAGLHDLCLLGWAADNGDPDNFLYVLFDPTNAQAGSARNVAFYKNPALHQILVSAQESSDQKEREAKYREAQDAIFRDAPWVPLAHAEVVVAARRSLSNLTVHPSSTIYFQRVGRQ
jgi:peptide/nickel transport system substrate-binding protein